MAIDRFLSSLLCFVSILMNFLIQFNSDIPFFIYFIYLIALVGFLICWRHKTAKWNPLMYAAIIALCFCVFFISSTFYPAIANIPPVWKIPLIYFDLIMGFALCLLFLYFAGGFNNLYELNILTACIAIMILACVANAGILLSIGLMVLGYGKHLKSITILGAIFLCLFLIEYYYSLSTTLSYKATLLIATGLVLLLGRFVMKYEHWDFG